VKLSDAVAVLKEKNPLQSYPVRFLGYTNELTTAWFDAIQGWTSKATAVWSHRATTAVATLYSCADVWRQGKAEFHEHLNSSPEVRRREVALETVATAIFQLGASVYVPPKVIEWTQRGAGHVLDHHLPSLQKVLKPGSGKRNMAMAVLGTLVIPVIASPIDGMFNWGIKHLYWPAVHWVAKHTEKD